MQSKKYYIGLMSGTSLDGVDITLVNIGALGQPKLIDFKCIPIPAQLKSHLANFCNAELVDLELVSEVSVQLAQVCAEAVNILISDNGLVATDVKAIGSHGVTIRHRPNSKYPFTLQITEPNTLAALTQIDVIADLRGMDVANGGQGAPLVPMFHQVLLREGQDGIFANLGGIANITVIKQEQNIIGYDTGPANTLMNLWCEIHQGVEFDRDGQWAASGTVLPDLLSSMLQEPYFQQPYPKSTGKELFNLDWLSSHLLTLETGYSAVDVQATLLELTVQSLANEIEKFDVKNLYLCGGGSDNDYLVTQLKRLLPEKLVQTSIDIGVSTDALEAMAFAWLAYCRVEQRSATATSITGAKKSSILGAWYTAK